jgi:hypothetical protein
MGYLSPTANQVSIATYTAIGHNTDSFASLQTRSIGGDDSFRAENLVGDLGFVVKGNNRVSVGFNNPTSRLYVLGEGTTSATTGFRVDDAMGVATLFVRDDRRVGVGTDTPTALLDARRNSATGTESVLIARGQSTTGIQVLDTGHVGIKGAAANTNWSLTIGDSGSQHTRFVGGGQDLVRVGQPAGGTGRIAILTGGNEKIVMSAAAGANAMVINSGGNTSTTTAFNIINSSSASLFSVRDDGRVSLDSTTGALLLSRMTTAQRDAMTAADGMIIYNTTTNAFNFRENGAWVTGSGLA